MVRYHSAVSAPNEPDPAPSRPKRSLLRPILLLLVVIVAIVRLQQAARGEFDHLVPNDASPAAPSQAP